MFRNGNKLDLISIIVNWSLGYVFNPLDKLCWEKFYGKSKYFPIINPIGATYTIEKLYVMKELLVTEDYEEGKIFLQFPEMTMRYYQEDVNPHNLYRLKELVESKTITFLPESIFKAIIKSPEGVDLYKHYEFKLNKKDQKHLSKIFKKDFGRLKNKRFTSTINDLMVTIKNDLLDSITIKINYEYLTYQTPNDLVVSNESGVALKEFNATFNGDSIVEYDSDWIYGGWIFGILGRDQFDKPFTEQDIKLWEDQIGNTNFFPKRLNDVLPNWDTIDKLKIEDVIKAIKIFMGEKIYKESKLTHKTGEIGDEDFLLIYGIQKSKRPSWLCDY